MILKCVTVYTNQTKAVRQVKACGEMFMWRLVIIPIWATAQSTTPCQTWAVKKNIHWYKYSDMFIGRLWRTYWKTSYQNPTNPFDVFFQYVVPCKLKFQYVSPAEMSNTSLHNITMRRFGGIIIIKCEVKLDLVQHTLNSLYLLTAGHGNICIMVYHMFQFTHLLPNKQYRPKYFLCFAMVSHQSL